ncbi:MAG TPA: class D sortase [Vicinamibacterales bacterium]|nr:class D sortase [Vicinamibacterales bacterium]
MIRAIERLLFVLGFAALGWYATAHIEAAREQAALSRELEDAQRKFAAQTTANSTIGTTTTTSATANAPVKVPTRALIGRIEVKRLKLSAVAREGIDMRTLRGAVGHIPGTALPGQQGNAAFAGHRDTFFRPLKDIRAGDEVLVTTDTGVHRYSVVSTRIVEPTDTWVLRPAEGGVLTLVTCYPFDYVGNAPKRFIVQASLLPAS